ncbi:MAG: DUF1353 domain-containing protein [Gammaproteobacteria bacterium]|nr:DUF1353 domain-containing protein [Gammaproteobacteria bacterium]
MAFTFNFSQLPALIPKLLPTKNLSFCKRLFSARRLRRFNLHHDWVVNISGTNFSSDINGNVLLPKQHLGKLETFDGASVPSPWLVTFLTFGVLRPLGIMLTASIVHDFAFRYGYLLVQKDDGEYQPTNIQRREADELFRLTMNYVNQTPVWAFIAWFYVRFGWLWVPYAGKLYRTKPPLLVIGTGCLFFGGLALLTIKVIMAVLNSLFV